VKPIQLKLVYFVLLALAVFSMSGCGGGGGATASATPTVKGKGQLSFTVKWPARTRLIPYDSLSIVATLTDPNGTVLGTQTLARPTQGVLITSVLFQNLPAEAVTLTASAYPNADGSGTAQATGMAGATITAGQTASVTVTMADTIKSIGIYDIANVLAGGRMLSGQQLQLHIQAYDANGDLVLVSPNTVTWSVVSGSAYGTVSSTGLVTMTATGSTNEQFVVQATETESGLTITSGAFTYQGIPLKANPVSAVLDPSGTHLYDFVNMAIHVFNINQSTGQLTFVEEVPDPLNSLAVSRVNAVITPDGKHMYICYYNGTIGGYNIASDGTLTATVQGTVAAPTNSYPSMACDNSSSFLYCGGEGSTNTQTNVYAIGSDGTLTLSTTQTMFNSTLKVPVNLVNVPGTPYLLGGCADLSNGQHMVTMTVNGDGSLALFHDTPVAFAFQYAPYLFNSTGATAATAAFYYTDYFYGYQITSGIPVAGSGLNITGSTAEDDWAGAGSPNFLFMRVYGTESTYITPMSISGDSLSQLSQTGTGLPANEPYGSVLITPNGQYIYTTNEVDNSISMFSVNSNGTLTALSPAKVTG
jgi:6-phosphogluconolactonase (cycloisomerase 2 family)